MLRVDVVVATTAKLRVDVVATTAKLCVDVVATTAMLHAIAPADFLLLNVPIISRGLVQLLAVITTASPCRCRHTCMHKIN